MEIKKLIQKTENYTIVKLPKIICGEVIFANKDTEVERLEYDGNVIVEIPKLTQQDVDRINANREKLCDLSLGRVTDYLINAGRKMLEPEDENKKAAIELGSLVAGYSEPMFQSDFHIIGKFCARRSNCYDMLEAEFGTHRVLDDFVNKGVGKIRAFPRGRVLHIMVGNVPLTSMFSAIRSILTKNQTIMKIPSRDPITCIFFALNLLQANPETHPINKSITAFYTSRDSDLLKQIKESSDMICAWGKGRALEEIKKTIPHSIPYLEFGPKRSLAIIYSDDVHINLESAALKMAHDLCVYDQEACFSPQRLFIKGEFQGAFLERLKYYLDKVSESLPKGKTSMDAQSYMYRIKQEAKYRGWKVSEGAAWNIIECDPYSDIEHPLGRTLFVHRFSELSDIIPFVDDETQVASVYPYEKAQEVANTLGRFGINRICELGMVVSPRAGWSHDGMYSLHYFVRLAHCDQSANFENHTWDLEYSVKYHHEIYGKPRIENFGELILDKHQYDWNKRDL